MKLFTFWGILATGVFVILDFLSHSLCVCVYIPYAFYHITVYSKCCVPFFSWIHKLPYSVAKRRRETADFPGAGVILQQLRDGPSRRRVGLRWMTGPPARGGAALYSEAGENVGKVTSGCPSPTLGGNIAMGYVAAAHAKAGTKLQVEVRGRKHPVEVAKMPFVKPNYFK